MRQQQVQWLIPLFAALSLMAARSAGAAGLTGVDTSGYPEVRVTVVAPPGSGEPKLTENGAPVAGLHAVNLGSAKSIVLAVDRSQSMKGHKLANATRAARVFVGAKNSADEIEVVAFGEQSTALTQFSTSAANADAVLTGLAADTRTGTALWDAVVQSAKALQAQGAPGRVIVVVTDGTDVSSSATFTQAIAAAHRARAAVYAIGIAGPGFSPAPLRELAAATGGSYLQTSSSSNLDALYRSIARTLDRTWQLRYVTAARPGDSLRLATTVGRVTSSRVVELPTSGTPVVSGPNVLPTSVWQSKLAPFVISLLVGLLALLACWFVLAARGGSWLATRLAPHLGPAVKRPARHRVRTDRRALLRGLFSATERAFANLRFFQALQQLLTRADLPLLASELLYICVGVAFAVAFLAAVVGVPFLLVLVVAVLAAFAPIFWVNTKARARMKAFDNQLPDVLITIAASLKAGHSFRQAVQAVVDEGAEPSGKEFRRVLTETRLGRPMDDALAEMGERIGSKNLTFVLTSVTIQRQIGGSLAGLFDMVAETVRQRQQFARKIRSLTAMGRMSAYVLGGLPVFLAILIELMSPEYMAPLWNTATGHLIVGTSVVMLGIGAALLKKIVSFRG
ncbi:MAG TPA: type II secretion system F family protein [Gaiellaceae bacterium]|nr:type II secretion system F family protein [Gaiellaceae bacterium]